MTRITPKNPEVARPVKYHGVSPPAPYPYPYYAYRAFTLVELLIVITIIAMLATMTLLVVGSAQRSARIASTEATIAKIDTAICEMYETYGHRRVEVPSGLDPLPAARFRLLRLYDLMRMEMPQNWEEVVTPPQFGGADPPLRQVYLKELEHADQSDPHVFNAKLLYQIVMNGNPESREMFGDRGLATDQQDGKPYFVDAWGRPICFLRWAPGFAGSDRQPDLWKWTGSKPDQGADDANEDFWTKNLSPDVLKSEYFEKYYNDAATRGDLNKIDWEGLPFPGAPYFFSRHGSIFDTLLKYPDPLDLAKIRGYDGTNPYSARPGFFLVPLVYSAGPDGEYGVTAPVQGVTDPFQRGWGAPYGSSGSHLDNIHNHRLGGR